MRIAHVRGRHALALAGLSLCLATICLSAVADEARLTAGSLIHFATVEQGGAWLAEEDVFLNSLSRFDCQARLRTDRDVNGSDVGRFAAAQVVAWTAEEEVALRAAIGEVREAMRPFDLPLPAKVSLVKTTGQEEGNAAYCRRNAIILPQRLAGSRGAALKRLLIHELFHVLSSHQPELRRELYAIVGFNACQPMALPPSLRDRKLTNPDAPRLDAYIKLTVDGQAVFAVPILFASTEAYDAKRGGTFFDYLTFRLMEVEPAGTGWQPALRDGQPRLLDPRETASYHEQIGRNTAYVIHPDEILADNFVHLINQTENLATPGIVASMRAKLARKSP